MNQYNIVAENPQSTIVAEYNAEKTKETHYQSEAELESAFIKQLQAQAYEYLPIHTEQDLINNLRKQIEKLNNYQFNDEEWGIFFKTHIQGKDLVGKDAIVEKSTTIQEDYIKSFKCADGKGRNIYLLNKKNIHNNTLQVINQYVAEQGTQNNRYDVSILVNGLPLVHIELKRRGVDIKEAFNQINRYQKESFWSGCGLFEYVQVFVISNGTYTKYYSNTTRNSHINEMYNNNPKKVKKTSNSFEYTSWWADARNKIIPDLMDFAKTFFAKHTILNILTKYCVFTSDKLLLVMRPYQIVATEKILNKIKISTNYKTYGRVEGGGYVWHTTGSGKTLTSFKTAQLATNMSEIDKVLFVVDRKDLDYQTMKEYDKFEKGAADSNSNTVALKRQLENSDSKIIITTIQKLTCFVKKNREHPIYDKHLVIIFDECHRSQFGEQHQYIVKAFKKYHLFGFTGTPIFTENAYQNVNSQLKTTEQIFGEKLHTYTIMDAINDENVLPFKVDYVKTIKENEDIEDGKVLDIDRKKALRSPARIEKIVEYILEHFNQKTKRNDRSCEFIKLQNIKEMATVRNQRLLEKIKNEVRLTGFNSIFAVDNIESAKLYYNEFKKQMEKNPLKQLKIATIYSYAPNGDDNSVDCFDIENTEDTDALTESNREFLEGVIKDYNNMFGTNYDTSADKFQNYYKDVSLRMKNREIDLLIVVNMFLTGFDATTLNTLWVDKNLQMQGLLQAYSRTNRILNSVKTFGYIVCFRNLEEATNKSIALFGNKDAGGMVLLKTFDEYYKDGYEDKNGGRIRPYVELIEELQSKYPVGEIIESEAEQKKFIKLYGAILKIRNVLSSFDEFEGKGILTDRDLQDYQSEYLRLYNEYKINYEDKEDIVDDVVFEVELVKQIEINIDYILILIKKYQSGGKKDKEIIVDIEKAVDASMELRSKKDLIVNFIDCLTPDKDVDENWKKYIIEQKDIELNRIILEENLNKEETYKFVDNAFKDGFVPITGTAVNQILPPVSLFTKNNDRGKKRTLVLEKIKVFFDRFKNVVSDVML